MAIKLISTDFDGTLFGELEDPPVPHALQGLLRRLQAAGVKWLINTGRDLPNLLEGLQRARLEVKPDYIVIVEREIYRSHRADFVQHEPWNHSCRSAHEELFRRVRPDVAELRAWVEARFKATLYEDAYSPFCFIAQRNEDADVIYEYLVEYSRQIPCLSVVRNSVYARFCHEAFNKGTAMAEVAREIGAGPAETFAIGDWLNDLPMLSHRHAHWLGAPANAIDEVKMAVRSQGGHVSAQPFGYGVADALEVVLRRHRSELVT